MWLPENRKEGRIVEIKKTHYKSLILLHRFYYLFYFLKKKNIHNESNKCKSGGVFFWKGKTHGWIEYKTFMVLMKGVILLFQCSHFIHPVTLQVVCFYTSSGCFSATGTLTGARKPFSFMLRAHCQRVKMTMRYRSWCRILQVYSNRLMHSRNAFLFLVGWTESDVCCWCLRPGKVLLWIDLWFLWKHLDIPSHMFDLS